MKRLWPLALVFATGCIPLPFAIPPAKLDVGAAVRLGDDEQGAVTFPLRAGVHLSQFFLDRHRRALDIGPGWGIYPSSSGTLLHGPFLEAGWLHPLAFDVEGSGWRWGLNTKGHFLFTDDFNSGFGLTLQATMEWTSFTTGPFAKCAIQDITGPGDPEPVASDSCTIGFSEGEGGVGFFVETSYAKLGGTDIGWVGGGLLFRVPASLGISMVPLWE